MILNLTESKELYLYQKYIININNYLYKVNIFKILF